MKWRFLLLMVVVLLMIRDYFLRLTCSFLKGHGTFILTKGGFFDFGGTFKKILSTILMIKVPR